MAEIFRITGKNNILLDAGPTGNYLFTKGRPPRKLSTVLTRQEVLSLLPRLPLGIRPLALRHGLSVITMELNIWGVSDTDMEAKEHDLIETLVETELYFSNQGALGTKAELMMKSDGAVNTSYKSVYFGVLDELDARDVMGAVIRAHRLEGLRLTLYCEPYWRPASAVELGPNEIKNPSLERDSNIIKTPSFERDGNADGLADNWEAAPGAGHPTLVMESIIVLKGSKSQKITTDAADEGIRQTGMVAPTGVTQAVAYAWLCRPAAGSDIRVELYDDTAGASRDTRLLSTAGWETKVVGVNTWYRVIVSSNAIDDLNSHSLRIYAIAVNPTIFYVDMAFWAWGTTTPNPADNWVKTPGGVHPICLRENTIVLNGCASQEVTTDAAAEGIVSANMQAPVGTTKAVAYAWLCRPAAGSDIEVRLYDVTAAGLRGSALFSTADWQEKVVRIGGVDYTWKRVVVSSNAIIETAPGVGNNHVLQILTTHDTPTVFYVDMTFLKWGTIACPDEWIDHYLVYNHNDNDINHKNTLDVADLKGDVDARLLMRTEFEQKADRDNAIDLIVGRRTRPAVCKFAHWIEAENATSRSDWLNAGGVARCSNAECVSNTGNTDGAVNFSLRTLLGAAALEHLRGSFDIYAVVFTNDAQNTQYQVQWSLGSIDCANLWQKQVEDNVWELIPLGSVHIDPFIRAGIDPYDFVISVAYQKDAGDTVKLDCIWLIPRDEPELRLNLDSCSCLVVGDFWAVGQNEDFDYVGKEKNVPPIYWGAFADVLGTVMTLRPDVENRLYFACISWDGVNKIRWYEAHGAATNLQMIVSLKYLPQFVSPLE